MALDLAVARTLHTTRILERALHEPHGWTIAVEGMHLAVVREVRLDSVTFTTHAPEVIFLGPVTVGLYFRGELQDCRTVHDPNEIVWELGLATRIAA